MSDDQKCPDCGHAHSGPTFGGIDGVPCARPGVVSAVPKVTTMAERLAHYLAIRDHTLSTDGLDWASQLQGEADYVVGEAKELRDAIEALTGLKGDSYAALARHVRHEIADVALANAALAGIFGVSVESCIAEKTEADRDRG